jgi:hypothetical protein
VVKRTFDNPWTIAAADTRHGEIDIHGKLTFNGFTLENIDIFESAVGKKIIDISGNGREKINLKNALDSAFNGWVVNDYRQHKASDRMVQAALTKATHYLKKARLALMIPENGRAVDLPDDFGPGVLRAQAALDEAKPEEINGFQFLDESLLALGRLERWCKQANARIERSRDMDSVQASNSGDDAMNRFYQALDGVYYGGWFEKAAATHSPTPGPFLRFLMAIRSCAPCFSWPESEEPEALAKAFQRAMDKLSKD